MLVFTSTFPRWADDSEPGFVFELSRRLTDRFDVTVLAPHAPGSLMRETMGGVRVVRFRYAPVAWEQLATYGGGILSRIKSNPLNALLVPPFLLGGFWALVQLMRRKHYAVIHAHWLIPQGMVALAALRLARHRPRLVCTSHGGDLYGLQAKPLTFVKRTVIRRSDHVTVVSTAMRDRALLLGASAAHLSVLPMGVELRQRFSPDHAIIRTSNELLFVGRLVEKKGLAILLDALARIAQRNPTITLTIAGDGPLRAPLEQKARSLGVADRVTFLGMTAQGQLPALYQRAALMVAPFVVASGGDQEGLGLVLVEAMGCGCPVIASDLPAVTDVIQHGKTGILVPSGNAEALARQISALLRDPDERAKLASAARNDVVARFDWSNIAARYGELLSTV